MKVRHSKGVECVRSQELFMFCSTPKLALVSTPKRCFLVDADTSFQPSQQENFFPWPMEGLYRLARAGFRFSRRTWRLQSYPAIRTLKR